MSIGNKKRFEVFKRDGFKCQYCGKNPPDVVLEVDHIIARSKNGNDEMDNLITSCFECNRGKRDNDLNQIPEQMQSKVENMKQKLSQYRQLKRYQKQLEEIEFDQIDEIETIFEYVLEEKEKRQIKYFIKTIGFDQVKESMELAVNKKPNQSYSRLKYFYGIVWNKIKGRTYGDRNGKI